MSEHTCTAHTSAGNPCQRDAIKGASVCATHGGSAPQVREAARRRLLEALDPITAKLIAHALKSDDPAVSLRACRDVLDRCGLAPTTKLEIDATVHNGDSDIDREIAGLLEKQRRLDDVERVGEGTPAVEADRSS